MVQMSENELVTPFTSAAFISRMPSEGPVTPNLPDPKIQLTCTYPGVSRRVTVNATLKPAYKQSRLESAG